MKEEIEIAVGARVMLTTNLNALHGLCNGVVESVSKGTMEHGIPA